VKLPWLEHSRTMAKRMFGLLVLTSTNPSSTMPAGQSMMKHPMRIHTRHFLHSLTMAMAMSLLLAMRTMREKKKMMIKTSLVTFCHWMMTRKKSHATCQQIVHWLVHWWWHSTNHDMWQHTRTSHCSPRCWLFRAGDCNPWVDVLVQSLWHMMWLLRWASHTSA
jgi:hypothetical protein